MSGFITTMFVPPASHASRLYPPFPPPPKPLQPVFTFAQSQSCMNLGKHLADPTIDPADNGGEEERWSETCKNWLASLALAKPPAAYTSPLQRVGEALRVPQTDSCAMPPGLDDGVAALKPLFEERDTVCGFPNYSYKLIPGSPTRSTPINPPRHAFGSGQGHHMPENTGTGHGTYTRLQTSPQRYNHFVGGTSLLFSLFRNPRTRAPFKPQKRGQNSWQLKQYAEATLGSGSLRKAVKLPEGEDRDEWLAVNGKGTSAGVQAIPLTQDSGRLLQPNQPSLWIHYRVLFATELS